MALSFEHRAVCRLQHRFPPLRKRSGNLAAHVIGRQTVDPTHYIRVSLTDILKKKVTFNDHTSTEEIAEVREYLLHRNVAFRMGKWEVYIDR